MSRKSKVRLVRNDVAPKAVQSPIQNLTLNLLPHLVRHDQMEGKDFVVVPMVILTEGVHAGSGGPMYYPPEELAKTPESWNHKPLVVYHPEINGQGVSACDPNIISTRKVGVMMNTKWEESTGRLKSEAWIDPTRADVVDPRIMVAVNANEMMEVSTGVFVDMEEHEGDWSGEEYNGIARNYRPDHLALLPDKVGACSISEGAGLLRNEASSDYLVATDAKKKSTWHLPVKKNGKPDHNLMGAAWAALHGGYRGNKYSGPERPSAVRKLRALYRSEGMEIPANNDAALLGNELSFDNVRMAIAMALNEKLQAMAAANPTDPDGDGDNDTCDYGYVTDVYSNFFVYQYDGNLWMLGYSSTDTGISIDDGDPTAVVRVTEYRTVGGAYVGNAAKAKSVKPMEKKARIDAILLAAAALGTWTEADRENLMAMNDAQLELVQNRVGKAKAATANADAKCKCPGCGGMTINTSELATNADYSCPTCGAKLMPAASQKSGTMNSAATQTGNATAGKIQTMEEYLAGTPKHLREVLENGVQIHNEEKARLVESIYAKNSVLFTKEELGNKPLGELRKLAALAGVNTPAAGSSPSNYAGMGHTTDNAENTEEVLPLPVHNFAKPGAAAAK